MVSCDRQTELTENDFLRHCFTYSCSGAVEVLLRCSASGFVLTPTVNVDGTLIRMFWREHYQVVWKWSLES